jgi:hypothetical protein
MDAELFGAHLETRDLIVQFEHDGTHNLEPDCAVNVNQGTRILACVQKCPVRRVDRDALPLMARPPAFQKMERLAGTIRINWSSRFTLLSECG